MENKLNILSESLDRKIRVLREIQEYNEKQEQAFKSNQIDMDGFDEAIEEKGRLIDEITVLDDGFEALYDQIAEELGANREQYAGHIQILQDKIRQVMELSATIQAQEARNKKLVEEYFANVRKGMRRSLKSSQAAYDYYKGMSGAGARESQLWDSKQ